MPSSARAGDQVAIKGDGSAGIVIAGDRKGDAVGIAIGVEHSRHRNMQAGRFLDRQLFLVGIDDEDQVGRAAHVADTAERLVELVTLARQHQALFLGQAGRAGIKLFLQFAQTLDGG